MGGSGSTRWDGHRKKRAVESCACIQVRGCQVSANTWGGSWLVTQEKQLDDHYIVLRGSWNGWKAEHWIQIEFWKPRFGGKALWLLCPGCGRKCRKLYAPPQMADYQCRACWKLAYQSSQTAHSFDRGFVAGLLAPMYAAKGYSMRQVEKVMRRDLKARR